MIRLATEHDLAAIAAIYDEILDHEAATVSYTNWQKGKYPCRATAENALRKGWLYVMEEDGQAVATAIFNHEQLPEYDKLPWQYPAAGDEVFVIHTLCVPPSQAGHGRARAFVAFAEALGREKGSTVMRLDTYEGNAPALAMYPKLGYRTVGRTMFHFQNLIWENLTCFEKRL